DRNERSPHPAARPGERRPGRPTDARGGGRLQASWRRPLTGKVIIRFPPLAILAFEKNEAGRIPLFLSHSVEEGCTSEKSAFRPSAIVGCARMASRKPVYGIPASIAVCTTAITS